MADTSTNSTVHNRAQDEFWFIGCRPAPTRADAICEAQLIKQLLGLRCREHQICKYNVYIDERACTADRLCHHSTTASSTTQTTEHRAFALAVSANGIRDYEILTHFLECPRRRLHEDYSKQCKTLEIQALAETAYKRLREEHEENEY